MNGRGLILASLLVVFGCARDRDRGAANDCPTWQDDIAAAVADQCGDCHGGDAPAAGYDLASYTGALGTGTDELANAIAGDPQSAILAAIDPATADETHTPFIGLHDQLEAWVVTCDLAYSRNPIHEPGLMNPADDQFHGTLLRSFLYDYDVCAECHGEDFSGGTSGKACTTCHTDEGGPKACTTCHGSPPDTGAHRAHVLGGDYDKPLDCSTCHTVPTDVLEPGHILLASGELDPAPAEVTLTGLAGDDASYDPATGTCTAYCHQPNPNDTAAAVPTPTWTGGAAAGECGGCHGLGPSTHFDDRCATCHAPVIGNGLDTSLHIDGQVEVGKTCTDCHGGGAAGAAPPRDLDGATSLTLVTIGAHVSHVLGTTRLRGPIPCSDCHIQPTAVDSPGHIDSGGPAEVFPPGFDGLASAVGAVPMWDRTTATCSDVYCHGGGTGSLSNDTASTLLREPVWTKLGLGQATCGTCHGVPPDDGFHADTLTLSDCVNCHPRSVSATGAPILTGDPATSEHMDGDIDVN